jgi:hypothetical protein
MKQYKSMEGFSYYYIDIEGTPDNYNFVLKAPDGQIVKVLENSKQIAENIKNDVYNLVYKNRLALYIRASSYDDDKDALISLFSRVIYPILLEQYLSSIYEQKRIRIQYPNINFYLSTLYKFYKTLSNPQTTLDLQEFAILISPLIEKINWNIDNRDLIYLFDAFITAYYKVLDYMKKARIGINPFMNDVYIYQQFIFFI